MKQISTWSGLEKALQKAAEDATKYAGEQIKRILHDNVQNLWYRARSGPYEYSRTYQVLESITLESLKNSKNGYTARVYFDDTKILPEEREGFFNAHMSLDGSTSYGGRSIGALVVEFMNWGQNSKVYSYDGVGFFEETYGIAKDDAVFLIEEALQRAGFNAVVV